MMNVHLQSHHEVHSCFHSYDDDLLHPRVFVAWFESCKNEAGVSQIKSIFTVRLYDNYLIYNTLPIMREDIFMVRDGEVMGYT